MLARDSGDPQLALLVARLVEGPAGPVQRHLLEEQLLPRALAAGDDCAMALITWLLSKPQDGLLQLLGLQPGSSSTAAVAASTAAMDPAVLQFLLGSGLKQLSGCRLPPQLALGMHSAAAVAGDGLDVAGLPVLALQAHLLALCLQPQQQDSSLASEAAQPGQSAPSSVGAAAAPRLAAALQQGHASQLAAKSLLHLLPPPAALHSTAPDAPQWSQQARRQLQVLATHLQSPGSAISSAPALSAALAEDTVLHLLCTALEHKQLVMHLRPLQPQRPSRRQSVQGTSLSAQAIGRSLSIRLAAASTGTSRVLTTHDASPSTPVYDAAAAHSMQQQGTAYSGPGTPLAGGQHSGTSSPHAAAYHNVLEEYDRARRRSSERGRTSSTGRSTPAVSGSGSTPGPGGGAGGAPAAPSVTVLGDFWDVRQLDGDKCRAVACCPGPFSLDGEELRPFACATARGGIVQAQLRAPDDLDAGETHDLQSSLLSGLVQVG